MIKLTTIIGATREEVYNAWLSSEGHAQMTDSPATASPEEGASFTAWDGYISGKNLELVPYKKIVQSWRTIEFPDNAPDSTVMINLKRKGKYATQITLMHKDVPEDQVEEYTEGWQDNYFEPMKEFFEEEAM